MSALSEILPWRPLRKVSPFRCLPRAYPVLPPSSALSTAGTSPPPPVSLTHGPNWHITCMKNRHEDMLQRHPASSWCVQVHKARSGTGEAVISHLLPDDRWLPRPLGPQSAHTVPTPTGVAWPSRATCLGQVAIGSVMSRRCDVSR